MHDEPTVRSAARRPERNVPTIAALDKTRLCRVLWTRALPALARFARTCVVIGCFALAACSKCEGSRHEVGALPTIDAPSCGDEPLPEGEVIAREVLRSGPTMREPDVVERFELRRRACLTVARLSQEWPLGTADLEVVYDAEGTPLTVWKRTTMPTAEGRLGHVELTRFELRSERVGLARRAATGAVEHFELRGARPRAVIGPGRGALTMWFRRARLAPGGRVREPVLDVREPIAVIRDVTLQRLEDREVEGLGRVRVYTIYGREPIFANDEDVVVGDLFGLRRASAVQGAVPDPMPDPGPFTPDQPR